MLHPVSSVQSLVVAPLLPHTRKRCGTWSASNSLPAPSSSTHSTAKTTPTSKSASTKSKPRTRTSPTPRTYVSLPPAHGRLDTLSPSSLLYSSTDVRPSFLVSVHVILIMLWHLDCALIVSRYVEQLSAEQSYRHTHKSTSAAFSTPNAGSAYYPHQPLGQSTDHLTEHHDGKHDGGYDFAAPQHSYGNAHV